MHITSVFIGQSQKKNKQRGRAEDMIFPGVSKKQHVKFQKQKHSRVFQKGIFKSPLFFSGIAQQIQCLTQKAESNLQRRSILMFIFDIYKTT